MKKLSFLIAFCWLLQSVLVAQNYYTIQLGTFVDAQPQDFSALQSLGFVHAVKTDVNLYVIYVGGYDNRAAAEKTWQQVRNKGYANAFIQERRAAEGQMVAVIQLATKNAKKPINWSEYAQISDLYAIINGDNIKIVTGPYANAEIAKTPTAALKKSGFKDAFIKNVNTIALHKLSAFETNLKDPLIPLEFNNTPSNITIQQPNNQSSSPGLQSYDKPFFANKGNPTLTPRTPNTGLPAVKASTQTLPQIRTTVKRHSALKLQEVLKTEGYYKGSLDGYYGAGTAAAYEAMKKGSRELQKYTLLAQNTPINGTSATDSRLQNAIDDLPTDPNALAVIQASKVPVAKAYQAYYLFSIYGANGDVNKLMNAAIKEAFAGKKLASQLPFDYKATYAYNDLEQLLLHLHYIHSAPGNDIAAPCWLSQRHPKEMKGVFERYVATASLDFPLKACDQFLNWDEVRLLHTIAMDLNPDKKLDSQELAQAASLRAMLYTSPKAITNVDVKDTEIWYNKLMTGLDKWGNSDALNKQTVSAFKAAFYQSNARLEDYYMDKGFKADAAKNLALVTLRTLVEYHLERFI